MAIASSSLLKLVRNVQRIGKKIRKATTQARIVTPMRWPADFLMAIVQPSRFLPMMRIRKIATMLARMTAMMPPAEALPTSKLSSACL